MFAVAVLGVIAQTAIKNAIKKSKEVEEVK